MMKYVYLNVIEIMRPHKLVYPADEVGGVSHITEIFSAKLGRGISRCPFCLVPSEINQHGRSKSHGHWGFIGPGLCYWVGSVDFNFLVETKVFSTKPRKSYKQKTLFAGGSLQKPSGLRFSVDFWDPGDPIHPLPAGSLSFVSPRCASLMSMSVFFLI